MATAAKPRRRRRRLGERQDRNDACGPTGAQQHIRIRSLSMRHGSRCWTTYGPSLDRPGNAPHAAPCSHGMARGMECCAPTGALDVVQAVEACRTRALERRGRLGPGTRRWWWRLGRTRRPRCSGVLMPYEQRIAHSSRPTGPLLSWQRFKGNSTLKYSEMLLVVDMPRYHLIGVKKPRQICFNSGKRVYRS